MEEKKRYLLSYALGELKECIREYDRPTTNKIQCKQAIKMWFKDYQRFGGKQTLKVISQHVYSKY